MINYQYHHMLKDAELDKDATTRFGSAVFLGVNLFAIVVQVALVGPVQSAFGPGPGVLSLPIVCIGASLLILFSFGLHHFAILSVIGQGLMYSLYQASRELLYVPTGTEIKFRAKAIIDTFGFRCGTATAALVVIGFQGLGAHHVQHLSFLVMGLCLAWIVLATKLSAAYKQIKSPLAGGPGHSCRYAAPGPLNRPTSCLCPWQWRL